MGASHLLGDVAKEMDYKRVISGNVQEFTGYRRIPLAWLCVLLLFFGSDRILVIPITIQFDESRFIESDPSRGSQYSCFVVS